MRGILSYRWYFHETLRITPAHAGNTNLVWLYLGSSEGSPPRMRGIQNRNQLIICAVGITPAHAGNTRMTTISRTSTRDHPRACGEYLASLVMPPGIRGSPPRMRGIPRTIGSRLLTNGITPAHAGNTLAHIQFFLDSGDHPRACGEYSAGFGMVLIRFKIEASASLAAALVAKPWRLFCFHVLPSL